jgi:hypothetical protein
MTNLHTHLQKETQNMRLTDAEKSAMRARLAQMMVPVAHMPVQSPYSWMLAPRSIALAAVAFLLVVSTGTTYAAEGSLPGQVLYPVKTQVIEPLTVALAPTAAAKAEANASIATTRVQEAQTLAADGSLTPAVAQEISTNYNEHATAALALAATADADAAVAAATATSTPPAATVVAVNTSATSSPAIAVAQDTSAPAVSDDTATSSDTDTVVSNVVVPSVATFSVRAAIAPVATSSTTMAPIPAVAAKETLATSSQDQLSGTSTLVQTLHASLSIQAKILDRLNAEVRERHTKTPH